MTTSRILQCRPRPVDYQPLGLDPVQIEKVVDPVNRQWWPTAFLMKRLLETAWCGSMDVRGLRSSPSTHGRDSRSENLKGDSLEITTTHIKEGYARRNGVPTSFRATVVEQISLDEPYLTWVVTIIDPDYLTEPLVNSSVYIRAPTLQLPAYPCQPEDEQPPARSTECRIICPARILI